MDLLKYIFRFLEVLDLCQLSGTCSTWYTASLSDEFWTQLSLTSKPMTLRQIGLICEKHGSSIRQLTMSSKAFKNITAESLLGATLPLLNSIQTLHLHALLLSDSCLAHVRDGMHQLTHLVLTSCTLSRINNGEACVARPTLQTLQMLGCRCSRLALRCPQLVSLSLRHSYLAGLRAGPMPWLQTADFGCLGKITDVNLRAALPHLVSLSSLCLERCGVLSADTVREVASLLPRLTRLDLQGCPSVTLQSIRHFPVLSVLVLNGCEGLSGGGQRHAIDTCPDLEELHMDGCSQLASLALSGMPKLRLLSLRSCSALASLEVRCRRLQILRLGFLPTVRFTVEADVVAAALASCGASPSAAAEAAAMAAPRSNFPRQHHPYHPPPPPHGPAAQQQQQQHAPLHHHHHLQQQHPAPQPAAHAAHGVGGHFGGLAAAMQMGFGNGNVPMNMQQLLHHAPAVQQMQMDMLGMLEEEEDDMPPWLLPGGHHHEDHEAPLFWGPDHAELHAAVHAAPAPAAAAAAAAPPPAAGHGMQMLMEAAAVVIDADQGPVPAPAPAPAAAASVPLSCYGGGSCSVLARVVLRSDAVKSINWSQFPCLETLQLDCFFLESLCLHDCDKLTDAAVAELGTSSRCRASRTPNLRDLRIESCDGLRRPSLEHCQLRTFALARCRNVSSVSLHCQSLEALVLEECEELTKAVLKPVGVQRLSLGSCSTLSSLELAGHLVEVLDLRGCAQLRELQLDCPCLHTLQATFCAQLAEHGLVGAFTSRPPLRNLVLSACQQVGTAGLVALAGLPQLLSLDLSYTDVAELTLLYDACPSLTSLNVSSCRQLDHASLMQVLPSRGCRLPKLCELDVSYCNLTTEHVQALLMDGTAFTSLALNGVQGVQDLVWGTAAAAAAGSSGSSSMEVVVQDEGISAAATQTAAAAAAAGSNFMEVALQDGITAAAAVPAASGSSGAAMAAVPGRQHQLRNLSLVKCQGLQCLTVGLAPRDGCTVPLYSPKECLFLDPEVAAAAAAALSWQDAPTLLGDLEVLRLGLSNIQVLALRLPKLALLDVNGCSQLRILELRCPLLLTLYMQSCPRLPGTFFWAALAACPVLTSLDVQHNPKIEPQVAEAAGCLPGRVGSSSSRREKLGSRCLPAAGPSTALGHGSGGSSSIMVQGDGGRQYSRLQLKAVQEKAEGMAAAAAGLAQGMVPPGGSSSSSRSHGVAAEPAGCIIESGSSAAGGFDPAAQQQQQGGAVVAGSEQQQQQAGQQQQQPGDTQQHVALLQGLQNLLF